jgi:hypothetical protein
MLLGVLAAGCGGENGGAPEGNGELADQTLPVDQYVKRADDICRDVAQRVLALRGELTGSPSADEVADVLAKQLRIVRGMRSRLGALGAPEGKREVAEEFVADIRDAEPHLERTIDAMRDGDENRANEAGQRYREASLESAREVRDSGLDFEVCGSGA